MTVCGTLPVGGTATGCTELGIVEEPLHAARTNEDKNIAAGARPSPALDPTEMQREGTKKKTENQARLEKPL